MWRRRAFLGTCGTAMVAGCLGDETDPETVDEDETVGYETRLDEIDDYDPLDLTTEERVEIDVGPEDEPQFDPDPVMVAELATIRWSWDESGYEIYPIDTPEPCGWAGADTGTAHQWEFPFVGKYEIGATTPDGTEFSGVMFVVDPDDV